MVERMIFREWAMHLSAKMRGEWLHEIMQDVRFGVRTLGKSRGIAAALILTLALGIGANTAIFSVVDAALLKPIPYKNPSRLLWVTLQFPKMNMHMSVVPHLTYFAWRDQNEVFSEIAATNLGRRFTFTGVGVPERISGIGVSSNFFSVLGIQLLHGRSFTPGEDRKGGPRAAILSYELWQNSFGASPKILGESILLDHKPYSIVGVLPTGFKFPTLGAQPEVFVPLAAPTDASSGIWYLGVVARLKPGITIDQAAANLSTIDNRTMPLYPKFFSRYTRDVHLTVISLQDYLTGAIRVGLWTIMGAVAFIFLIACANITNLQLSRGSGRTQEFALRSALGASHARMARQLLIEGLLVSTMGGLVGLAGGESGLLFLRSFVPRDLIDIQKVHINLIVLAFTIILSALAGVVSGFAPILSLLRPNLAETIQEGRAQVAGSRSNSFMRTLMGSAQVAAAVVLLVSAGLLLKSFLRLTSVNTGFNSHNLLTAQISLPDEKYSMAAERLALASQLLDRLHGLPGVYSASVSTSLPNIVSSEMHIAIQGGLLPASSDPTASVPLDSVSNSYFHTLETAILSGRGFDSRDESNSQKVAIVNREFVDYFFQSNENPIGKQILLAAGTPFQSAVTIVGVSAAVRRVGPTDKSLPQIFLPFSQSPSTDLTVLLRTASKPLPLVSALRSQVLAIDKELPLAAVTPMDDLLAAETDRQRFDAAAVCLFAAIALMLAGIGIYGVISYTVSQRNHEIGIHMALGAQRYHIVRMMIRSGFFMAGTGMALGIICALGLTQLLRSLLFQITSTDPDTYSAVAAILICVALLACYVPVRRAIRVDPMAALRHQ
jgi:putative ABC transport system permease protein